MDTSVQSDSSKNSNGDYAEIGPELMSSVRFHSLGNSHYSEITDIMLQPVSCQSSESSASVEERVEDFSGKENPYDEPDSMKPEISEENASASASCENALLCHNYSRLERMPRIYVTSESDRTSEENQEDKLVTNLHHHSMEKLAKGNPCPLREKSGQEESGGLFPLPDKPPLPTILEHSYHILEPSDSYFDPEVQGSKSSPTYTDYMDQPVLSCESDYDRLVDPQFYKILDRSANLSKIYDIKSGPYSKLETSQSQYTNESPLKIDLSTEIFDDVQYIASPVPTPKSADVLQEMGTNKGHKQDAPDTRSESTGNKYYGDYERDPIYMQKMKGDQANDASKSLNFYQPLEVTAMDPVPDYEHYLKPNCPGSLDITMC